MTRKKASRLRLFFAVVVGLILFAIAYGTTRYLATISTDQRSQADVGQVYNCSGGSTSECPVNQGYTCINKVCKTQPVTLTSCTEVCPTSSSGLCTCPASCGSSEVGPGLACGGVLPTNAPQTTTSTQGCGAENAPIGSVKCASNSRNNSCVVCVLRTVRGKQTPGWVLTDQAKCAGLSCNR